MITNRGPFLARILLEYFSPQIPSMGYFSVLILPPRCPKPLTLLFSLCYLEVWKWGQGGTPRAREDAGC